MARQRTNLHTRWIYFLCSIVLNLALVYAFIPSESQKNALVFLALTIVLSGLYILRQQALAQRTFLRVIAEDEVPGWGKPAMVAAPRPEWAGPFETVTYAVWTRNNHSASVQRRLPRSKLGKPETVIAASLGLSFAGKVIVHRRAAGEEIAALWSSEVSKESFKVDAEPPEAADRFLDATTWSALVSLAALEDPIHQLFVSLRGGGISISLQGELEDAESVRIFLEKSFEIVDRAAALGV